MTGTAVGDKRWIEMQATKDAALAREDAEPRVRDRELPVRRHIPAAGAIARAEGDQAAGRNKRCRPKPRAPQAGAAAKPGAASKHQPRRSRADAVISGTAPASGGASRRCSTTALLLAALLVVYTSGAWS